MEFRVGDFEFGKSLAPVVITEIGINHGGSLDVAKQLAAASVSVGGKLIKHQTHIPDAEMSIEAEQVKPGNSDSSIYEVISSNSLSLEEERKFREYVMQIGATYFSTPFSFQAVDFLSQLGVELFKIGSGECNNFPLVEYVASQGRPVILSTGMNDIPAIRKSVEIIRKYHVPFVLMHTTNLYPTPHQLLRLGGIQELEDEFPDAIIGLSDHSTSNASSIAAVALGARVIERHFTDSKSRIGPDIICSMDPKDLSELLVSVQEVFKASGGTKRDIDEENVTRRFAFASVVASEDIEPGEELGPQNITLMRPSGGDFGPEDYYSLFGTVARQRIPKRTQIAAEAIFPHSK